MGKKTGKGSWWRSIRLSGIIDLLALAVTCAGVWVSVKTLHQTEYVHEETQRINQQMGRNEMIRQSKESIDKYLVLVWYDRAVKESNRLNDSLRVWNMEKDSTCRIYLEHEVIRYKKARNESAVRLLEEYLKQLQ